MLENLYTKYLESEMDEISLLRETHNLLIEGKTEEATRNALKLEAVRYVKKSLLKVDYEFHKGGTSQNS